MLATTYQPRLSGRPARMLPGKQPEKAVLVPVDRDPPLALDRRLVAHLGADEHG